MITNVYFKLKNSNKRRHNKQKDAADHSWFNPTHKTKIQTITNHLNKTSTLSKRFPSFTLTSDCSTNPYESEAFHSRYVLVLMIKQ